MNKKQILSLVCVVLITALFVLFFSRLLTPTWTNWNNDNTVKGFYAEKKNRLQVVFVGTSQSLNGISPMELYHTYGICALNLSSEQQPLLASYYWIKEAERLHGKTLRTVVLDLSFVFQNESKSSKLFMNEKALTHMRFSGVKLEAYRALAKQYDVNVLEYLVPLIRYHSRWSSVTAEDFRGLTNRNNTFFTRGQNVVFDQSHDVKAASEVLVPNYRVTEEINHTQEELDAILVSQNLDYLDQIAEFCKEKGLDLVFIKIPKASTDVEHDALQYLANRHDLPLLDFNLTSVQEEIGFDFPYDFWDTKHPNAAGARKLTNYIGAFITEHSHLEDIRDNPDYDYMKAQDEQYRAVRDGTDLISGRDFVSYLKTLDHDRYTILISVLGDACEGLGSYEREALADLGFTGLGTIGEREPYVGIKSCGTVVADERGEAGETLLADGRFSETDGCTVEHVYHSPADADEQTKEPSVSPAKGRFFVKSSGKEAADLSVIMLAGKNRSDAKHGINIAVYDHQLKRMIDTSCFDMSSGSAVRTDIALPYEYRMRVTVAEMKGALTIGDYVRIGNRAEDCTMILCGTMTREVSALLKKDREVFAEYGIADPSFIDRQPFVLVVRDGTVLLCETVGPNEPLYAELLGLVTVTAEKPSAGNMIVRIGDTSFTIEENSVYAIAFNGNLNCIMNSLYLRKL